MKLPNSKIYWADYLSYSALLSDTEVCQVMKIIAMRAMSYENPQDILRDNPQENPQVSIQKQIQIHIQKLNQIQLDFYKCLEKSQDESARDYIASITNGKKGGRPKKSKNQLVVKNEQAIKKPSLQEVVDYCKERNNTVDANKWYDYYTSNGWKVGKNTMKDWKAAVRTWERTRIVPQKTTQAEEVFNHNFAHLQSLFEGEENAQ